MNIKDIIDLANARSAGYGDIYSYEEDYDEEEAEEPLDMRQRFQRSLLDATNKYQRQENDNKGSGAMDYEG